MTNVLFYQFRPPALEWQRLITIIMLNDEKWLGIKCYGENLVFSSVSVTYLKIYNFVLFSGKSSPKGRIRIGGMNAPFGSHLSAG